MLFHPSSQKEHSVRMSVIDQGRTKTQATKTGALSLKNMVSLVLLIKFFMKKKAKKKHKSRINKKRPA
jgi:hypothetical protein